MEQETGIGPLYAEFFRGYESEIELFRPDFRPNSAYNQPYTLSYGMLALAIKSVENR
jgi:hypothetical protein